ncbi:hypothetical protein PT974_08237 [Cladobotryum mycophilum]|uniref:Fido domain-containing protein n=1 Tax=Cladobotryum mycophilum TaxID=491253 RepID=A0ABR0SDD0_9HYPO
MDPQGPENVASRNQKHKRKALNEIFDISAGVPQMSQPEEAPAPPSPLKRQKMSSDLKSTIRTKWPSLSGSERKTFSLALHAEDVYQTNSTNTQDPKKLFEKASQYLDTLREMSRSQNQNELLENQIHDMMIHAVFGSNCIERAGLGLDATVQLCKKVLNGETLPDIVERSPEYRSQLMEFLKLDASLKGMPVQRALRSRREVVQHMKAFQYLLHHFVIQQEDMTEDLIKETHRILCRGVSIIQDDMKEVLSDQYAGRYRDVLVGAGNTMFVVPKHVPSKMRQACDNLNRDLDEAEKKGAIDPFFIASKYSMEIIQIHPFQDGNGRLCRMILNAIVFRYTGILISIGESEEDRSEYMSIHKRVSEKLEGHEDYATLILKKGMRTIQKLKQKLHGKKG